MGPEKKHDFAWLRNETLRRLIDADPACSEKGDEAVKLAAKVVRAWRDKRNNPVLFPGAIEALQALRDKGLKIGTLTDGNADPTAIDGLRDLVDFTCRATEEAGAPKPDRRAFALCEAKANCTPAQLVMVGDNAQ